MLVFDTSAYINGRRHHFLPTIVPSVWRLVQDAIQAGHVVLPREVYRELMVYDDDVAQWIEQSKGSIAEPSREVQQRAGVLQAQFPQTGIRHRADPFILA